MRENFSHFVTVQHHRETHRSLRPFYAFDPPDFLFEHLFVEKKESAQSLVLRLGSNVSVLGQMCQEIDHFRLSHLARMPFAVIQNETANPICVSLLSADAEMFASNHVANLI